DSAPRTFRSPAAAGPAGSANAASPIRPLRASDVHDSSVRRIATITPDMVAPRPHKSTRPARTRLARRSRIETQYPQRESTGKSPDRERRTRHMKMRGLAQFCKNEFAFLPSGRPKAAAAAISGGQRCGNGEFRTDNRRDHHLRDSLAAADRKRRLAVIDQDHADLAAV